MFNYNGVLSLFDFVSVIVKKFNGSFAKHAAVIASNVKLAHVRLLELMSTKVAKAAETSVAAMERCELPIYLANH